jgi:hypothetical protein
LVVPDEECDIHRKRARRDGPQTKTRLPIPHPSYNAKPMRSTAAPKAELPADGLISVDFGRKLEGARLWTDPFEAPHAIRREDVP